MSKDAISDALRLAKRKKKPVRFHHTIAREGYATDGAVTPQASTEEPEAQAYGEVSFAPEYTPRPQEDVRQPDDAKQEAFIREELKGSAPQYDPTAETRLKNAAVAGAKWTAPGAAADAMGMLGGPSLAENVRQGRYLPAAMQVAAVGLPAAMAGRAAIASGLGAGASKFTKLGKPDVFMMPGYVAQQTADDWAPGLLGKESYEGAKMAGKKALEEGMNYIRRKVGYADGGEVHDALRLARSRLATGGQPAAPAVAQPMTGVMGGPAAGPTVNAGQPVQQPARPSLSSILSSGRTPTPAPTPAPTPIPTPIAPAAPKTQSSSGLNSLLARLGRPATPSAPSTGVMGGPSSGPTVNAGRPVQPTPVVTPTSTPATGIMGGPTSGPTINAGQPVQPAPVTAPSGPTGIMGGPATGPTVNAGQQTSAPSNDWKSMWPEANRAPPMDLFNEVGQRNNFDPQALARYAYLESRFDPSAVNKLGYKGMFQFGDQAMKDLAAHGKPLKNPLDPVQAAQAAVDYMNINKGYIQSALDKTGTKFEPWMGYAAHQQGGPGFSKLISNPNQPAWKQVGVQAVLKNGGKLSDTSSQFLDRWKTKFNSAGVGPDNSSNAVAKGEPPPTPPTPSPAPSGESGKVIAPLPPVRPPDLSPPINNDAPPDSGSNQQSASIPGGMVPGAMAPSNGIAGGINSSIGGIGGSGGIYSGGGGGSYGGGASSAASDVPTSGPVTNAQGQEGYYTYETQTKQVPHTTYTYPSGNNVSNAVKGSGATPLPGGAINIGGNPVAHTTYTTQQVQVPTFHAGPNPNTDPFGAAMYDTFGGGISNTQASDPFADVFGGGGGGSFDPFAGGSTDWGGTQNNSSLGDIENGWNGWDFSQLGSANGGSITKERAVKEALRIARQSGGRTPAWQRSAGKNPAGGLNAKGRASAKAEGHDLKPPAPHPKTEKDAGRRKSFCARSAGQAKMFPKAAKDPDSRLNKARRAWNCADGGAVEEAVELAKRKTGGKAIWNKPRPKDLGGSKPLTSSQKASAKATAQSAGRKYPNMIDNIRASRKD